MNTIPILSSFLGWSLVLNLSVLIFTTIMITLFKRQITKIHAGLFDMKEETLGPEYFRYLANYKLLVTVFNLAPWLALKLMGAE